MIKGSGNSSAIGTLVERKSRYTILAKMKNCGAEAALKGFEKNLNRVPNFMRETLTYDQGREMSRHEELANKLKINVYFCDLHSPWQRPTNENTNGLIRQYLPKGIDLMHLLPVRPQQNSQRPQYKTAKMFGLPYAIRSL